MTGLVQQLVDLRRAHGLTQVDVAARLRTTQSHVSRMERTPNPRLATIERYAEAIGCRLTIEPKP